MKCIKRRTYKLTDKTISETRTHTHNAKLGTGVFMQLINKPVVCVNYGNRLNYENITILFKIWQKTDLINV